MAAVAALVYAVYALSRHEQYLTAGYDLGIFDQAVRAYSRFQEPVVPLKGLGFSIWGDHFHPIIATLAPLYWVWDDPRMLLLAQAVLVAVSTFPVAAFLRRRFGEWTVRLLLVAYLGSWPLQGMIDFDFHEIAFAVPLIAWSIDGMDRRSRWGTIVPLALLLLVREDMGAYVVAAAVILALHRRWRLAATAGVVGAAALYVTTAVVIPAFSPTAGFAYWTFTSLGATPGEALRFMVTHPLDTLRLTVTPGAKVSLLGWLLAPTLGLSLLSPYVVLTVPFLAQRLLNDRPNLWTPEFHYSGVLAPILFMAAGDGVARLRRRFAWSPRLPLVWATVLAVAMVGSTLVVHQRYPLGRLLDGSAFSQDARMAALDELLPLVPPGVTVAVDDRVAPHLTPTTTVVIAGMDDSTATWAVLDLSQKETSLLGVPPAVALTRLEDRGFVVVASRDDIVVLRRGQPR